MSEPNQVTDYYVVCGCGKEHPRGIVEDYEITCPECEEVIRVPKAKSSLRRGDEG